MNQSTTFLGATNHLYDRLCRSVGWSVCRSVTHSLDDPHVAPYWPTWPLFFNRVIQTLHLTKMIWCIWKRKLPQDLTLSSLNFSSRLNTFFSTSATAKPEESTSPLFPEFYQFRFQFTNTRFGIAYKLQINSVDNIRSTRRKTQV